MAGKKSLAQKREKSQRGDSITPRSKSQDTLSNRKDQEEELDEIELATIKRRERLAKLNNIGNASKVGTRPGEKPPKTEVIDHEFGEESHTVSIFRRDINHRQDVHMSIISKHRAELVNEALGTHIRERLAQTFTKKRNSCILAIEKFFTCHWEHFSPQEKPFLNKHPIEDFID